MNIKTIRNLKLHKKKYVRFEFYLLVTNVGDKLQVMVLSHNLNIHKNFMEFLSSINTIYYIVYSLYT